VPELAYGELAGVVGVELVEDLAAKRGAWSGPEEEDEWSEEEDEGTTSAWSERACDRWRASKDDRGRPGGPRTDWTLSMPRLWMLPMCPPTWPRPFCHERAFATSASWARRSLPRSSLIFMPPMR